MSLFDSLNIARTGLLTQQRAIQTTGRNIANVNTPGYARQRPIFAPIPAVFGGDGLPRGGGVELVEIERVVDLNLEAQLQREQSRLSFDTSLEGGLARIEGTLDELSDAGLSTRLDSFFKALSDVANDPADLTTREAFIQNADSLASQIRATDLRFEQLETDLNTQLGRTAQEINEIAAEVASLNQRIREQEFGTAGTSELRDRRTFLLNELGQKVDFTTFEREDGTAAVFVGGGFVLVDGETSARLEVDTAQPTPLADPTFFNLFHVIGGTRSGPITSRISGGELGATLELRDDRVQFYRQQVDRLAFTLASRVNTVHAAGRGLVDASSRNLFVDRLTAVAGTPPGTALASVQGAASRIAVNADLLLDGRNLAAGTPTAGPALPGDNRNALALASIQTQASAFFDIGDPAAGPATGAVQTLNQFVASTASALGAELAGVRSSIASGDLAVAELSSRREALSGVSIDEEVTQLVRFQRGFEASARLLSTVDELLDRLLSI
jgi:flagellar hook-associated protein 1